MQSVESIYEMVDRAPAIFERMVLTRLMFDPVFVKRAAPVLFTDHEQQEAKSFDFPVHAGLGRALLTYHETAGHSVGFDWNIMEYALKRTAESALISSDMSVLQEAWGALQALSAAAPSQWNSVVWCTDKAMVYWLKNMRNRTAASKSKAGKWSMDTLQQWLREEGKHITQLARADRLNFSLLDALKTPAPDVVRLLCSIPKLNVAIGGGFGCTEASLIVCPSGAGKTVISTQLSGEWCMQGKKGVLVTTERSQGHHALALRMFSQLCNIPFAQISNGLDPAKLAPDQRQSLEQVSQFIRPENFQILEWFRQPNTSAIEALPDELDRMANIMGGMDFFILDWLGGALGEDATSDKDKLRLTLSRAASTVATQAGTFGCVGIATAQAHSSARNKVRVQASDARENKNLDQDMTNSIGISALQDKAYTDDDGGNSFLKEQFMFAEKTRKGPGGLIPVSRRFEYQKFTPRAALT